MGRPGGMGAISYTCISIYARFSGQFFFKFSQKKIVNVYYLHLFVLHWCVTIQLYVPCMLAAQVLKPYGFLYVWLLSQTCVVVLLISNRQKRQKSSNLQPIQASRIGKYSRWKLFNFVVVQVPARTSLIILTAYSITRMFSEKQPYPSLFYYYRCCLFLQY